MIKQRNRSFYIQNLNEEKSIYFFEERSKRYKDKLSKGAKQFTDKETENRQTEKPAIRQTNEQKKDG